ncbi:MAG: hypothetical protein OXH09_06650 [Gammaproteobacteria bacterium]|nr:hypothetical protein [Gammaproteobacteria bacterium]
MTNISRRTVIAMSGKMLLALAASGAVARAALAGESESVSWERFLELCHELSRSQFAPNWNQDTYTREIEGLVRRLKLDDRKIVEYIDRYRNLNLHFPEIRRMYHERQFQVSLLDFEPGEEIPLHDHPDMTGVVYCTTGWIVVDHYDKLQQTAENGNPLLRFERHLEMAPGDTATLTATRGNIHMLSALQFTRMIDVFTPPYDRDRVRRSRYYAMDSTPYLGRDGVFEAEASVSPR